MARDDAMTDEERREHAESLNYFYCRFDRVDCSAERNVECDRMRENACEEEVPVIEREMVERVFKQVNARKAAGPDNISGKLIKACGRELSDVFCDIFNKSMQTHTVPS